MNVAGFVGPSYNSISRAINEQRCVNLRLEIDQANGKAPVSLVGLPGYAAIKSDLTGEVRGSWRARGRRFVVIGSGLYEIAADLTHTLRASLPTAAGHVSIADNGLQMIAVDGVGVVLLTLATNGVTTSIDNFPAGATFIIDIDNTFIANEAWSQRFAISAVGDGTSWRAIDFSSVEGSPDDLVAVVAFNRQAYMLGTDSMQVLWNSGDATRPFIPVEGSFFSVGCIAPFSACADETGVYWLGADARGGARVYKAAGGQVAAISTVAMDAEFAGLLPESAAYNLTDAKGYTFREAGHTFYVLTFPTTDKTWLFDVTTEAWSEFLEWTDGQWHRTRLNAMFYDFGKLIGGDKDNGKLYEVSSGIFSNDGAAQRALRASAHTSQDEAKLSASSFEVVCQSGAGLTTGQGKDPQMMLRVQRDHGHWGPEMWRPIGQKGEYRGRCRWTRPVGDFRSAVWEVSITDPVKRAIVKAVINQV